MSAQAISKSDKKSPRYVDAEKRGAIVEAARSLFLSKGYESTTMAEVAEDAGVAVGTVYLYFKNKNDLLRAVRGDWENEFVQFFNNPDLQAVPHHLRARPIVEACFNLCNQNLDTIRLMHMQPEMIGGWKDSDADMVQQAVEVFFKEAVEVGAFRPIDTHVAAAVAYGMVDYTMHQCFGQEGGQHQQR